MRVQIQFFTRAARRGWQVFAHPADHIQLALTVLAVFGLPTTVGFIRGTGLLGVAVGVAFALIVATLEGAFQLWRDAESAAAVERTAAAEQSAEVERISKAPPDLPDPAPVLGIGRAHLPKQPQYGRVEGFKIDRPARLIQVPVMNAQGAGEASAVHAELNFMPDDRDGQFSPRHAAQGEWADDSDRPTEINLLGNGRIYLLNVALVFNDGYPCVYEWTRRSRDAGLRGYGMWSNRVEVEVVVKAAGPSAPCLRRTLIIEVHSGLIHANWDGDDRSNWVGVEDRGWEEQSFLPRMPRPQS